MLLYGKRIAQEANRIRMRTTLDELVERPESALWTCFDLNRDDGTTVLVH